MKGQSGNNQKGITLIELLVALIIFGVIVAGIYRVFVAQSKAYSIQDQVVEIQQTTRSAMEMLLMDVRMAGYDSDSLTSKIAVPTAFIVGDSSITASYEYSDTLRHTVAYRVEGTSLMRRLTTTTDLGVINSTEDMLLENVDALSFVYGVDQDENGVMDDRNGDGILDQNDWVSAATVTGGGLKVIAVRVALTARPEPVNPDVQKMVSPRTLVSAVTVRNQCLIRK